MTCSHLYRYDDKASNSKQHWGMHTCVHFVEESQKRAIVYEMKDAEQTGGMTDKTLQNIEGPPRAPPLRSVRNIQSLSHNIDRLHILCLLQILRRPVRRDYNAARQSYIDDGHLPELGRQAPEHGLLGEQARLGPRFVRLDSVVLGPMFLVFRREGEPEDTGFDDTASLWVAVPNAWRSWHQFGGEERGIQFRFIAF